MVLVEPDIDKEAAEFTRLANVCASFYIAIAFMYPETLNRHRR
jgi:hypothetical protein